MSDLPPSPEDSASTQPRRHKHKRRRKSAPAAEEMPALATPPPWRVLLLAGIVIVSFLLGSGRDTWALGASVCLIGLGVVCAPPVFRLPRVAAFSLLAFGLLPLVGLLPASWLGISDGWRDKLWETWGLAVSPTVSPDPRATFESWLVVAAMVTWLWACLGQGASVSGRRLAIYTLAVGGAVISLAALYDFYVQAIPWWPRTGFGASEGFGPFSNRNHASSLAAISTVLCAASAYDAWRRRSSLVWVFALLLWAPLVSIFLNTSRGGLLLLFIGAAVWLTSSTMNKGLFRKVVVGASVFLVVVSIAFVSTGRLGGRLRSLIQEEKVSPLTSSLRVDLAAETLSVVADRPWVGQGFDSFVPVFPLVSDLDLPDLRLLHPESDLLLLLFEGGLLGLLPCVVLLVWFARSTCPWRHSTASREPSLERADRRLRHAAAIGAGMALLHSIFDVPNHLVGYAMHTALLMGLAVRPASLHALGGLIQRGAFTLAGLGAAAVGVLWLGTGLRQWTPDLPTSVPFLRERVVDETRHGRYREALPLVDRMIWLAPLDYRYYYLRAQVLLQLRQRPGRALRDFGRSRALEPNYAMNCFEEGVYWLGFVPELAIIPWRECLRRQHDPDVSSRFYSPMCEKAQTYPEILPALWTLAENAGMRVTFLSHLRPANGWQDYLTKFLALYPRLETVEPGHLHVLLILWNNNGDRPALFKLLEEHPRLQSQGWRILAQEMARNGRYDDALALAAKYLKRQSRAALSGPSDIARLERAFLFHPADPRPGVELYHAQRAAGNLAGARVTAEKVAALPDAPPYMKLELAFLYLDLKDPRRAWDHMQQAMESMPEL